MESRHSSALSSLGSCMWLRTKKWGTGMSQVLKYSTGVSRSTKRKERTIMPSSPGTSSGCPWTGVAHDNREGAAPIESAAVDICFRKLRLEFIAFERLRTPPVCKVTMIQFSTAGPEKESAKLNRSEEHTSELQSPM